MKPVHIGTCKTCQWWEDTNPLIAVPLPVDCGECHIYPPISDSNGGKVAVYPLTKKDWWCNEYKKET